MKAKICYQVIAYTLFLLLSVSCTVQLPVPRKMATYLDFTKYPNFYMSQSLSIDEKYTPLGLVTSSVVSGYKKKGEEPNKMVINGQNYYDASDDLIKRFVGMTAEDAVNLIYEKAKAMGANGIIGIKIDYIPSGQYLTYGFSASGMAIKINVK